MHVALPFTLFLPEAEVVLALAPNARDHAPEGGGEVTLDRVATVRRGAPLEILVIVNIALVHHALVSAKEGKEKEKEKRRKKRRGKREKVVNGRINASVTK